MYTNELQNAFPIYAAAKTPEKLKPIVDRILNIFTSKTGTIYDSRLKATQTERETVDVSLINTLMSLVNLSTRMANHTDSDIKSYGAKLNKQATQLQEGLVQTAPLPPPVVT